MSNLIEQFEAREQENIQQLLTFNLWCRALIQKLVDEYEGRLTDSNLPVESADPAALWQLEGPAG